MRPKSQLRPEVGSVNWSGPIQAGPTKVNSIINRIERGRAVVRRNGRPLTHELRASAGELLFIRLGPLGGCFMHRTIAKDRHTHQPGRDLERCCPRG
jgi:hypothetical protein